MIKYIQSNPQKQNTKLHEHQDQCRITKITPSKSLSESRIRKFSVTTRSGDCCPSSTKHCSLPSHFSFEQCESFSLLKFLKASKSPFEFNKHSWAFNNKGLNSYTKQNNNQFKTQYCNYYVTIKNLLRIIKIKNLMALECDSFSVVQRSRFYGTSFSFFPFAFYGRWRNGGGNRGFGG
jgi:uncharacterized Rmd1/YagE family protein